MKKVHIAVDFGGGSGRVMAAEMIDGVPQFTEIHRFANNPVTLHGIMYWDFPALYREMIQGLRSAVAMGLHILSVGIDTWGVDFGLLDKEGNLLSNPECYRSESINGVVDEFFADGITPQEHYAQAGIQIMDINSVFRLKRMMRTRRSMISAASTLLFMPDLFSYFLTAEANVEYTIATTSGLIDAQTRAWNWELIQRCGLPKHLFGRIVQPGTIRGYIQPDVLRTLGIDYEVPVVAVGSHDTASAVYASQCSFDDDGTAFLSSGTWSLLGVSLQQPILSEAAREAGFTNEGGVGNQIRFLQNITGLWILQCLRREWESKGLNVDYEHLISSGEASDCRSVIDVDDTMFHSPHSMIAAIDTYCARNKMAQPTNQGDYMRCVMQSLANRYKKGIDCINELLPKPVRKIKVIGGGGRNRLLNDLTAQATGLIVECGTVEATAVGNVLVQAKALEK